MGTGIERGGGRGEEWMAGWGLPKGQAELFWGKVRVVCTHKGERDMGNADS